MRIWLVALFALCAASAFAADELAPDEGDNDAVESTDAPIPADKKPPTPAAPKEAPPPPAAEKPAENYNAVVLQGLNKVTGHLSKFNALVGTSERFGNLEIIPHRCWQSPPEERPENAALLEIRELKTGETPTTIFTGWMFSSSPGLSALEHPVYDITVLSCSAAKPEDEAPSAPAKK